MIIYFAQRVIRFSIIVANPFNLQLRHLMKFDYSDFIAWLVLL
jgi:hypothetical protein